MSGWCVCIARDPCSNPSFLKGLTVVEEVQLLSIIFSIYSVPCSFQVTEGITVVGGIAGLRA